MKILTDEDLVRFGRDGYFLVPSLFESEEMNLLRTAAKGDPAFLRGLEDVGDGEGGVVVRRRVWTEPADDLYGVVARLPRIVDAMGQLLGGDVAHWGMKMSMKPEGMGREWPWHQDCAEAVHAGYPYPAEVGVAVVAVDFATRFNGGLEVLPGSHRLGRLEAAESGGLWVADPVRVSGMAGRREARSVEMEPGDVLFLHGCVLHRTLANASDLPRWLLLLGYVGVDNAPFGDGAGVLEPVSRVWDGEMREVGIRRFAGRI